MTLSFTATRPRRRRPDLTPMIDVVFLLLIFFMLASRFGTDQTVPLALAGQGAGYSGPPRLVEVGPASVALNGVTLQPDTLSAALRPLMQSQDDAIILRPGEYTSLQDMITVMDDLAAAGFTRLILVE